MEESKKIEVLINSTLRGIIRDANNKNLTKLDIISLLKEGGQFVLVYYK